MANHETAIKLLADQRDYWLSRIDSNESAIAARKADIIRLREEKEAAAVKVDEFDRSIEALKSTR